VWRAVAKFVDGGDAIADELAQRRQAQLENLLSAPIRTPTERVRELERLLAKLRGPMCVQVNYEMWQQRGEEHATPEYRAEMERDFAEANREYAEASKALEALVEKTRAEAPHEIDAWTDAHDAYLALLDDVAAGRERTEWAEVRAGTRAFVVEHICYAPETNERYRALFGIDL
jgi:hypothetical protein